MVQRRVHWWRGKDKPLNFGDELNEFVLRVLGVDFTKTEPSKADLVLIGSVLEHLPRQGWTGTVAGAGQLFEGTRIDLSDAEVLALRGKLTAERVRGLDPDRPPVLGDPALLVPQWVRQYPAQWELGIVPHWSDTTLAERFPYGHLISPNGPPTSVISKIAQCRRIISSSLHGIIVADAYGIPRQAELFPNADAEGGDYKYRDYASIYPDGDPHFGEMWTAPADVVRRTQRDLRRALDSGLLGKVEHVIEEVVDVVEDAVDVVEDAVEGWFHRHHHHHKPAPQISLLVPFRDNGEHRTRVWTWLRQYWEANLGSVEVVLGHDEGFPFSKAVAVNDAASRARGRVFVILDADAYMDARVLQACVDAIDAAVSAGRRLWYMPYNHLYRLNLDITTALLEGDPTAPYRIPSPPPEDWREKVDESHSYGHRFGAMIQVMPREAFFLVGGMDPRFRGWGSEDVSLLRALDTLYCQHEVAVADLVHFWHERPGDNPADRHWIGQVFPANSRLAQRYSFAVGEPGFMSVLVNERDRPVQPSLAPTILQAVDSSLAPMQAGTLDASIRVVEVPFSITAATIPGDAIPITAGELPPDVWVTPVI